MNFNKKEEEMTTLLDNKQLPHRCNQEILKKGNVLVALEATPAETDDWVGKIAKMANTHVDWHYYDNGIAEVFHYGDDDSQFRVKKAIDRLASSLRGLILIYYEPGEQSIASHLHY
jgi:hypothetical protein